jgi:hypothetical protein
MAFKPTHSKAQQTRLKIPKFNFGERIYASSSTGINFQSTRYTKFHFRSLIMLEDTQNAENVKL